MSVMVSYACLAGNELTNQVRTLAYLRSTPLPGAVVNVTKSHTCCQDVGERTTYDAHVLYDTRIPYDGIFNECDVEDVAYNANLFYNSPIIYNGADIINLDFCLGCWCEALSNDGQPYTDPITDEAPWYDANWSGSADFLGFYASSIELDSPLTRTVTPKSLGGAVIGQQTYRQRVIAVTGNLYAASNAGMNHGERWLYDVLQGSGCGADEMDLLPFCGSGEQTSDFRTLKNVGLIDGPDFSRVANQSCIVQECSFQLAAGVPFLHAPEDVVLDDATVSASGSRTGEYTAPTWRTQVGGIFRIDARETVDSGPVRIKMYPLATGQSVEAGYHNPCVDLTITSIEAGEHVIIDPTLRTVQRWDKVGKRYRSGWGQLSFDETLTWPVIDHCTRAGWVVANNGSVPIKATVTMVPFEL